MSAHHKEVIHESAQASRRPLFSIVSPVLSELPADEEIDTCTLIVPRYFVTTLKEIAELLEADRACGKPSGFVRQARRGLKRLLKDVPA